MGISEAFPTIMHNGKRSFAAFKDDKKVLFEDFFESSDDDGDGDCG